ncbi:MAG: bifunctional [glutamate--ammonia ligase]-adenylyl-L-tyrosine phosphorylase/[glutamate--ammonia-ligase] adenylyltransferase [Gammaproteobacteria bacterium]
MSSLPAELQATAETALTAFDEKLRQLDLALPHHPQLQASLLPAFLGSQFIAESCIRNPLLLLDLADSGDLFSASRREHYAAVLTREPIDDEAALMTQLRHFRRREMVRIAWRDLAGWADLDETLGDLSALAEVCIEYSLEFLYLQACARRETPYLADGRTPQRLVVLGMGKLGAWELNYSSDIDLIFAYAEDGVLTDRKATSYGEFFIRLARSLVKVLDDVTADGFVFRVDTRLRPFGDSGPLVMSFDGMEHYYQTQAREWERYAMIKARQVAGDRNTGPQLLAMLKPFVYRRYLDYGAFEELRSLKYKITQELKRKDRLENVKLGPGGIREIEFIGQAFQLIRGGQEKRLRQRGILPVLQALADLELLAAETVRQLHDAYVFLRRVENRIQQYQDKQTHDLPADPLPRRILSHTLGFSDWESFKTALDEVRAQVHAVFAQVFSTAPVEAADHGSLAIWTGKADPELLLTRLYGFGYRHCEDMLALIQNFKTSSPIRRMTAKGAAVLDRLMPQIIEAAAKTGNAEETLQRLLKLLEAVAGRNVYLSLLAENPDALQQLIKLSAASPWLCDYLARYPVLFDELLDTRTLYEPLGRQRLEAELQNMIDGKEDDDFEQVMIALRQFKQINVLRVACADIMGVVPVMVVSDYLTYIAEAVLTQVLKQAWRQLAAKHGTPPGKSERNCAFAIIAFGKLGGLELGYGSDLDLVFLYDCPADAQTGGERPVSAAHFYTRLGQKVMTMLNTAMLSGILYEVDMRLRPSGNSGLLVPPISAYEDYLLHEAWTWEHQALVRGRFIAGDPCLQAEFERIRRTVLRLPRERAKLRLEVREMREKMRDNLAVKDGGRFDLKHSKGGIADIEFIVQFGILALAAANEQLTTYTDNVRQIEALHTQGFIDAAAAELLKKAYCAYRDRGHTETLQERSNVVDAVEFAELRLQVERLWQELMED